MCYTIIKGLHNVSLSQPLTPTDAKPDMAMLRLIKESELRRGNIIGSGAFGTVYKVRDFLDSYLLSPSLISIPGSLDPYRRKCQNPGRHQGPPRRNSSEPEQGIIGRSEDHDLRGASVLHPYLGRVHDGADDAHHATHASGLSARLCAQEQNEHWFKSSFELVHANCKGKCL